jgi:hypothetical protein
LRLKNAVPNPAAAELHDRVKALGLDAELVEVDELGGLAAKLTGSAAPGDAEQRAWLRCWSSRTNPQAGNLTTTSGPPSR